MVEVTRETENGDSEQVCKERQEEEMHTLINTSDKTKVTRSPLKRLPQVWIIVLVCIYNSAAGEDDLEVSDVVAGKATGVRVE